MRAQKGKKQVEEQRSVADSFTSGMNATRVRSLPSVNQPAVVARKEAPSVNTPKHQQEQTGTLPETIVNTPQLKPTLAS